MSLLRIFFLIVFIGLGQTQAQVGGCLCEDGSTSEDCCPPGDPVPISGIEILIGAGVLLGIKKIVGNRYKKEQEAI